MTHNRIPKVFYESDDPNRLVHIVWKPEDFMIAVGGDPLRNNAYVFAHSNFLGFPTAKKIEPPKEAEAIGGAAKVTTLGGWNNELVLFAPSLWRTPQSREFEHLDSG